MVEAALGLFLVAFVVVGAFLLLVLLVAKGRPPPFLVVGPLSSAKCLGDAHALSGVLLAQVRGGAQRGGTPPAGAASSSGPSVGLGGRGRRRGAEIAVLAIGRVEAGAARGASVPCSEVKIGVEVVLCDVLFFDERGTESEKKRVKRQWLRADMRRCRLAVEN